MDKISIYRKKLSKKKELELRQDVIVPDIKKDMVSILDGNFFCYFSKVEILNERIKVSGNIDSYISYISSSEETEGLQNSFNFDDVLENKIITEDMNLKYNIEVLKQEIKIINERKISILITVQISYEVYGIDEIEFFNDFNLLEDIQIASKKINLQTLVGVNSNLASLKEEIKVDGSDVIEEILKVDTNIINKEIKISYNKVLTKADLQVKIIYLTKDGRIVKTNEKFPIVSFIELENVKEENVCSTDYQIRNILLNINNSDENSITIQMEYEIICKAFENIEQEVVSDLYSLKYDTEITSKEIEIMNNLSESVNEKIDINERINLENTTNVIDVFGKCKAIKDGEGEVELKIYFESNNKIGLNVKTITLPVINKRINNQGDLILAQIDFDFNNNVLSILGNMEFQGIDLQKETIKIVQNVVQKNLVIEDEYGMIIYSVKKNDSLWNVAKKFRVKQESIIHSNELEEPYNLNYGEKIYIIR